MLVNPAPRSRDGCLVAKSDEPFCARNKTGDAPRATASEDVRREGDLIDDLRLLAVFLLGGMMLIALSQATAVHAAGATKPACTIVGTPGPDILAGTPGRDVICGLGGNDVIDGGPGSDIIRGGPGNDAIIAWDGQRDLIDGGPGRDRAWTDLTLDRVRSVEVR